LEEPEGRIFLSLFEALRRDVPGAKSLDQDHSVLWLPNGITVRRGPQGLTFQYEADLGSPYGTSIGPKGFSMRTRGAGSADDYVFSVQEPGSLTGAVYDATNVIIIGFAKLLAAWGGENALRSLKTKGLLMGNGVYVTHPHVEDHLTNEIVLIAWSDLSKQKQREMRPQHIQQLVEQEVPEVLEEPHSPQTGPTEAVAVRTIFPEEQITTEPPRRSPGRTFDESERFPKQHDPVPLEAVPAEAPAPNTSEKETKGAGKRSTPTSSAALAHEAAFLTILTKRYKRDAENPIQAFLMEVRPLSDEQHAHILAEYDLEEPSSEEAVIRAQETLIEARNLYQEKLVAAGYQP
jgi:hypothetical protein